MSSYTDKLINHPVKDILDRLYSEFTSSKINIDLSDNTNSYFYKKITNFYQSISTFIKDAKRKFITKNILDNLNNQLSHNNFMEKHNQYINNPAQQTIIDYNTHVDQIINNYPYLFISTKIKVDQKQYLIEDQLEAISERNSTLENNLKKLNETIEKQQALIETKNQELNSIISTWQEQFSNAQENRREEYNSIFSKLNTDYQSKINAEFDGIQSFINEEYKNLHSKKEKIEDLFQIVSSSTIYGKFSEKFKIDNRWMHFWRIVSFLCIVGTAAFSYCILSKNINEMDSFTFTYSLIRNTLFIGILLLLSKYASKIQDYHRNRKDLLQTFELEMAAIEPFLSNMNDEESIKLKSDYFRKVFGNTVKDNTSNSLKNDVFKIEGNNLISILKSIIELLKK